MSFKGKAIYNPSGKAGEYSYWACNFYNGCSNGCEYCYCKKGLLARTMGGDEPTLKKCFRDKDHALDVFKKEVKQNIAELRKHGLFFSFTTDPMLPETIHLTLYAIGVCLMNGVSVKILTKRADFLNFTVFQNSIMGLDRSWRDWIAFGFTLTGHDELEPNASTNAERIDAMRKLHDAGFKTFASIEPIVDFERASDMIVRSAPWCDLFKIGLMSGKKYPKQDIVKFMEQTLSRIGFIGARYYFKDSLLKQAGVERENLPANCVDRDFNLFNVK